MGKKSHPQLKVILEAMRGLLREHPGMKVAHMGEHDRNYGVMRKTKQLIPESQQPQVPDQALPCAAALPAPPRT